VKSRDDEQLEEVRSPKGTNRAAIGNLHECFRMLVGMIQTNGTARKASSKLETSGKRSDRKEGSKEINSAKVVGNDQVDYPTGKTGYEEVEEADVIDTGALQDELDALDFDNDDSSMDDDSIDLR